MPVMLSNRARYPLNRSCGIAGISRNSLEAGLLTTRILLDPLISTALWLAILYEIAVVFVQSLSHTTCRSVWCRGDAFFTPGAQSL